MQKNYKFKSLCVYFQILRFYCIKNCKITNAEIYDIYVYMCRKKFRCGKFTIHDDIKRENNFYFNDLITLKKYLFTNFIVFCIQENKGINFIDSYI